MRPLKLILFASFLGMCSTTGSFNYEIESNNINYTIPDKINIFVNESSKTTDLSVEVNFIESEPKVESIELVFSMKFTEDYEDESKGVCIGPDWEGNGPGEIKLLLNNKESFKKTISAINNSDVDRCMNYFYYLREFKIFTFDNETILIGVASNYAKKYPDAPEVWLINKNNVIDKIGDTNIEKYSLNFELSK